MVGVALRRPIEFTALIGHRNAAWQVSINKTYLRVLIKKNRLRYVPVFLLNLIRQKVLAATTRNPLDFLFYFIFDDLWQI